MKLPAFFLALFATLALAAGADLDSQYMPIALGMMAFPQHPSEQAFRKIEAKMNALPKLSESDSDNHALLLSAGFLVGAHSRHGWPLNGKSQTGKAALEILSKKGEMAKWIGDDKAVNDEKFDYWWMEYLGSQDEKILAKILKYAGDPTPYKDGRALLVQVASWSFKSNCCQIQGVRDFAEKCLHDPAYKDREAFLKECLAQKFVDVHAPKN